jgi:hypothetical protein
VIELAEITTQCRSPEIPNQLNISLNNYNQKFMTSRFVLVHLGFFVLALTGIVYRSRKILKAHSDTIPSARALYGKVMEYFTQANSKSIPAKEFFKSFADLTMWACFINYMLPLHLFREFLMNDAPFFSWWTLATLLAGIVVGWLWSVLTIFVVTRIIFSISGKELSSVR